MSLKDLKIFFNNLELNKEEKKISKRLLKEIKNRLEFLANVGLDYLTLNRKSNTLSGGESQRINLATSLGSSLVGSMYILDEPSIGLHSKDTERLINVLYALRDLGNTVIVVEHDEAIMESADYIIDIGPEAGTFGGKVMANGSYETLLKSDTLTCWLPPPPKEEESPPPLGFSTIKSNKTRIIDVNSLKFLNNAFVSK